MLTQIHDINLWFCISEHTRFQLISTYSNLGNLRFKEIHIQKTESLPRFFGSKINTVAQSVRNTCKYSNEKN